MAPTALWQLLTNRYTTVWHKNGEGLELWVILQEIVRTVKDHPELLLGGVWSLNFKAKLYSA